VTIPVRLQRAASVATAAVLILALGVAMAPTARAASPGELEACFLDRINLARSNDGAEALGALPSLSEYGRTHSTDMSDAGYLFHSGSAQVEPELPAGWRAWGENVGYATGSQDCDWLFQGFWESPNHRANLLNPIFDTVGIGVIIDTADDTIWTTHVFVQTAAPPPATTTTTTSIAPTTTTTAAPTTTASAATTTPLSSSSSAATTTTATLQTTTTTSLATPTTSEAVAAPPTTTAPSTTSPETSQPQDLTAQSQVAGVGQPCSTGCSNGARYALFLGFVAGTGLAISWWAFRS
jgi:uncharacterized protein YkwD